MNITRGRKQEPVRVVIYGPEGIGKSTLASGFPNPLFIDTEGGSGQLDVARTDKPSSWEMLIAQILSAASVAEFDSVIIDTGDWTEKLAVESVIRQNAKASIEDFGYGKGYQILAERFAEIFPALDKCVEAGKNVCIVCHAMMRKFEQPDEMGAYDRWELKLSKKVASLVKEWCDALFFLNYKTIVVSGGNSKKAQGGRRVMYTQHHPCWDAKNRFGLAEELPVEFDAISGIFPQKVDKLQILIKKLEESGITFRVHEDSDDSVTVSDAGGNEHEYNVRTEKLTLKSVSGKTIEATRAPDALVKAMTMPDMVKKVFRED